jgi:prepilin-type N-terminal cleavage/methylation domain-containing protein
MLSARRNRGDDSGVTLIELLVAVFLVGVVGSVVTAGIVTSMRTTRQDQARASSASQLRTALDRLTRDLRASDPLRAATATTLTMDEDRAGKCRRTYYRIAGTSLDWVTVDYTSLSVCKTNAGAATPSTGWVPLVQNIDSASSSFTYYNDNISPTPITPTGMQLSTLTRVGITIVASQAENRAATTLSSIVDLRNAR